ncbi:hypothetical protein PAPYR_1444 [Paratrimastix pyriformis]|uniref:Uncharacterized protein n=1 Tax=Paratrimastix pyriformis TaxID=342808 RepID=A0ABQ8UUM7_9EUKA|nr:hypothetical protein PAPYR_1444 [Paratrimastix pyriformis]
MLGINCRKREEKWRELSATLSASEAALKEQLQSAQRQQQTAEEAIRKQAAAAQVASADLQTLQKRLDEATALAAEQQGRRAKEDQLERDKFQQEIEALKDALEAEKRYHEADVHQLGVEKDQEMETIGLKIKDTIAKKDHQIAGLQTEMESLQARNAELQNCLEKQRQELLMLGS